MDMQTIKARLEEVTVQDVLDMCELRIPSAQVEDTLSDAIELLTDQYTGDVDSLVEDYAGVLDRWRCEHAPSWIIYNWEIEQVISEAGIGDVLDLYANNFGGGPESIGDMINVVHWDLAGAVESVLSEVMAEMADDHTEGDEDE